MTKNLFIKNVRFGRFLSFYASCACGQVSQAVFCGKGSGMVANRAYKFRMYPNDKFPYGKPQTDEVARGSGTESMAVRD